MILVNCQQDQDAQECPQNDDLSDFRCCDEDFSTLINSMTAFWNPYDKGSTLEELL